MRERRIRQATEIDDVGAGGFERFCARQNPLHISCRRINNLREYPDVITREVGRLALGAEIARQIGDLVRPALEAHAKIRGKLAEIGVTAAGHDDAVGFDRPRQTAADDFLGHQRRDLHPDIVYAPFERHLANPPAHAPEPPTRNTPSPQTPHLMPPTQPYQTTETRPP